ncbi:orotidine-5'-phosphate decarboxylase [Henriciella barbarensis]|uniref:Orotidine 5'-phosphate decarboxylase n=1 Tax=Henriciella barbarensis TaxID=86342 RepID=A0A399R304_9PROT|nr:orotidine-5'-phosphate decarboxylase [Henriciella barbarensis]RIJ24247.1 orotidine-5'-phosphate decarboxylase [Henriciella barbarensis]
MNFADRLVAAADEYGPLCVGLDPHAGRIPDLFGGDTPDGVEAWGLAMVEVAKGRTGVIKPQSAFYERHGWQGMRALTRILEAARDAGLTVLMDAKRGDIGSTAAGYAAAFLAKDAPFPSDALTVNPYMGLDTLEPHVKAAAENGKGVIVLARTSNPGSADFQSKSLEGAPLFERIVEALAPMIERLKGDSGWSGLMLVTGATGPQEARRLRELAPDALFLVPGYGAQGAGAADAMSGFVRQGDRLCGGVVSASRSVSFPPEAQSASTLGEWRTAIAGAINAAQADLMTAAKR